MPTSCATVHTAVQRLDSDQRLHFVSYIVTVIKITMDKSKGSKQAYKFVRWLKSVLLLLLKSVKCVWAPSNRILVGNVSNDACKRFTGHFAMSLSPHKLVQITWQHVRTASFHAFYFSLTPVPVRLTFWVRGPLRAINKFHWITAPTTVSELTSSVLNYGY